MKRITAVFALALAVWAIPAQAVDDALSIEANQKYLEENAKKKGVIVRPSGLQIPHHPEWLWQAAATPPTRSRSITPGTLINHGRHSTASSPGLPASMKLNRRDPLAGSRGAMQRRCWRAITGC